VDPGNGDVGQEDNNNARRRGLRWGLGIVTVQWIAVSLLVAGDIIVDGANHFYGPSGLCELIRLSCTAYLDKVQGAGFSPTIQSSILFSILALCG
jgi:hypothetical protein